MGKRNPGPKKYTIACHWYNNPPTLPDGSIAYLVCDIGEPSCWACGCFDSDWDVGDFTDDPEHNENICYTRWERAELEKCHIKAHMLGGSNEPDNYVLMCNMCHRTSPHFNDPTILFAWMKQRPMQKMREIEAAINIYRVKYSEEHWNNFLKLKTSKEFWTMTDEECIQLANWQQENYAYHSNRSLNVTTAMMEDFHHMEGIIAIKDISLDVAPSDAKWLDW